MIWLHRMYFKKRAPKFRMIKKSTKSKVGTGMDLIEEEVEIYQNPNHDDVVQGIQHEEHGQNEEEVQNPEEEDEEQSQEEAEEVQAQNEEEENQPQEFHLEPAPDPVLELQIYLAEQSEVSEYNELPPEEQNEEQENNNATVRRSNRAVEKPEWLNDFDVANTGVDDLDTNDQMTLYEGGGVGMGNEFDNTQELHTITYNTAMKPEDTLKWKEAVGEENKKMEKYKVFKPIPID